MPLPSKDYTWEHRVNRLVNAQAIGWNSDYGANGCAGGAMLLEMKNSFCNVGHSTFTTPWVVKGSCDTVAGAMDNVDRWDDVNDVREKNRAESWIVLEQSGLDGAQLLFELKWANPYRGTLAYRHFSTDKYSGGSVSTRPTAIVPATDRILGTQRSDIWFQDTSPEQIWCHAFMTSDGTQSRFVIMAHGRCCAYMAFDTLKNSPLARPTLAWWPDKDDSNHANAWYKNLENPFGKADILGAYKSSYGCTQGYSNAYIPEWPSSQTDRSDFTNEFAMWPLHWNSINIGAAGYLGQTPDCYLAPLMLPQGQLTPNADWIKLGDMWLPWDGSSIPRIG